jgi:hypothetical protein
MRMNIFSRKRGLPKGGVVVSSAPVSATTASVNVTGVDNTSVATEDSKSMHSHSQKVLTPSPSPQEIYRAEKQLQKNRQLINKFVRKIGNQANLNDTLELDSYGFCYIPFRRFLIILSVPAHEPEQVILNTMIFDLNGKDETRARNQVTMMQHRRVHLGKQKSIIRLEGDEVYLCNCFLIRGLRYSEMVDRLDDFMETALTINTDLTALSR